MINSLKSGTHLDFGHVEFQLLIVIFVGYGLKLL